MNETLIVILRKQEYEIYLLNDDEEVFLHYSPMTIFVKKIEIAQDTWVAKLKLSLEKRADSVGKDCNLNSNYNRAGKSI